ncbi:MAG: PEP/pyruvate-binding domain-containing protein [Anaerolineaceae bacterium]
MDFVKNLDQFGRADLPLAGGKGANLGAMIQAGMTVPPGFCVTTRGYNRFIDANTLKKAILDKLVEEASDNVDSLEKASTAIRQLFLSASIPEEIENDIKQAYRGLMSARHAGDGAGALPVAVRSSATAEDLPDLSFAGQQDTYLNILGEAELVKAVKRCWASLWTARAIDYRRRNGISQEEVSLAVVVQCMVQSEVSGVLFTANPLTGKRSETVIDATFGLGEALVSGMVEPDHYVIKDGVILEKTLGSKSLSIQGLAGGGTHTITESAKDRQALPDTEILALEEIGRKAEEFFGCPQDMEWGWAEGRLFILQSRAITTLFPIPGGFQTRPLEAFFSVASWQGMVDPFSQAGHDILLCLIFGMGQAFGIQTTPGSQTILKVANGRLFLRVSPLIRSQVGRTITRVALEAIDPVAREIINELFETPAFAVSGKGMSIKTGLNLARVFLPTLRGTLTNWASPTRGRRLLQKQIDRLLEDIHTGRREVEGLISGSDRSEYLPALVHFIEEKPRTAPRYLLPYLLPAVASGQAPLQVLLRSVDDIPDGPNLVMELTRGLPYNVTTEMDLKLWQLSRAIITDPDSLDTFLNHHADELAGMYASGEMPSAAQRGLEAFLETYGLRGLAEIDQYRERWVDNPTPIIQILKGYLKLEDELLSPERMFIRGERRAEEAAQILIAAFRRRPLGVLQVLRLKFMINRIRELAGLRETPKFTFIRILGEMRRALRAAGERLAAEGVLDDRDDIFFLHLEELKALGRGEQLEIKKLVFGRKDDYRRQMAVRRIPRIILSDGTVYYDFAGKAAAGEGTFLGSPVSAGIAEGRVHVVLNPNGARLLPGEILVCPATDPAWTPLFLTAGGLITEIGGMITHGSVVAREYGIPAVVGITDATTLLKTGQRIRLNGSTGLVTLLEDENDLPPRVS